MQNRKMRLTSAHVALCQRDVADAGPQLRYENFDDRDYDRATEKVLEEMPATGFWLFAYGSLIWKPEFPTEQSRKARAKGWQRAFSLEINRYRGTDEQHGYMMCLDEGGECEGVALKLSDENLFDQVRKLMFREISSEVTLEAARWINLETGEGPLTALTFYANPHLLDVYRANRPFSEIAYGLARACGHWGSGAEYLYNTVSHLEAMGIHDANLWTLQDMVAAEIEALHGFAPDAG